MTAQTDLVKVRVPADLVDWLKGRAARTMTQEPIGPRARTELVLWRGHLAAELARLRLTLAELGCLADILNGTIADDSIAVGRVSALAAEVIDGLRGDPGAYGDKWGIDERALEDLALNLGPTATHALRDAIARWWETHAEHTPDGWASVGITVKDQP